MTSLHTSRDFEAELRELRSALVTMGARCERAVHMSVAAFLDRDSEQAAEVVALDERIDRDEVEIDDLALRILALRQPVAYDLRFLATTLKFVTDLERIGDKATSIARRVKEVVGVATLPGEELIVPLSELSLSVLREALSAFVEGDAAKAEAVLSRCDEVDAQAKKASEVVISWLTGHGPEARVGLAVLVVVRQLKRVADHVTNLAEQVVFLVSGDDVRHHARAGKP